MDKSHALAKTLRRQGIQNIFPDNVNFSWRSLRALRETYIGKEFKTCSRQERQARQGNQNIVAGLRSIFLAPLVISARNIYWSGYIAERSRYGKEFKTFSRQDRQGIQKNLAGLCSIFLATSARKIFCFGSGGSEIVVGYAG